jgi:hypothetical protein
MHDGIRSSETKDGDAPPAFINSRSHTRIGNSGGPVTNDRGEVIGLVQGGPGEDDPRSTFETWTTPVNAADVRRWLAALRRAPWSFGEQCIHISHSHVTEREIKFKCHRAAPGGMQMSEMFINCAMPAADAIWIAPLALFLDGIKKATAKPVFPMCIGRSADFTRQIEAGRYSADVDLSKMAKLLLRELYVRCSATWTPNELIATVKEFEYQSNMHLMKVTRLAQLPPNFAVEIECTFRNGRSVIALTILQKLSIDDLPDNAILKALYIRYYGITVHTDHLGHCCARKIFVRATINC